MSQRQKLACVIDTLRRLLQSEGVLLDETDYIDRVITPSMSAYKWEETYSTSLMIDVAHKLQGMLNEHLNKEG